MVSTPRILPLVLLLSGCWYVTRDEQQDRMDLDGDGVQRPDDCDDADAAVAPGVEETCNGVDDDCNDAVDDGVRDAEWYFDADGDGFGGDAAPFVGCVPPAGYVAEAGDCAPDDASIGPAAPEICDGIDNDCDGDVDRDDPDAVDRTWYLDTDADGYGDDVTFESCSQPPGYALEGADCDDANRTVHPTSPEVCDAVDNDCDGSVDGDDADAVLPLWYADADGDGHGDPASVTAACAAPPGAVAVAGDCDDEDVVVNASADEVCGGGDEDCDGLVDDDDFVGDPPTWFEDVDGDGFGDLLATLDACAPGSGFVDDASDCDDLDDSVFPGADETCDGADDDCDGSTDEDAVDAATWYPDVDGDGHGVAAGSVVACAVASGSTVADDCDDADRFVYVGAPELCDSVDNDCDAVVDESPQSVSWYADADADAYGETGDVVLSCNRLPGRTTTPGDCAESDAAINPGALEVCDGIDNDCDSAVDASDSDATGLVSWYADEDADGYGDKANVTIACSAPAGTVDLPGDCADDDASRNPGADEVCDGLENDCDGRLDDADNSVVDATLWHRDADGDTYGSSGSIALACDPPAGFLADGQDCDDGDTKINPAGSEVCNGRDDDCDGTVDVGAAGMQTWYLDADGDFAGDPTSTIDACFPPAGYVVNLADCDDADAARGPGANEQCNGVDDDCDGSVDDNVVTVTWYADLDLDGFGDPSSPTSSCKQPAGFVGQAGDCDDKSATISPAGIEVCNTRDDDCDGFVDESGAVFWRDADGDGHGLSTDTKIACTAPLGYVASSDDCNDAAATIFPGAAEVCDGLDQDCDFAVDNGVRTVYYRDQDGDLYGVPTSTTQACVRPAGYADVDTDCDDLDKARNPGVTDVCDGVDNNCDGSVDNGNQATWYADVDGDLHGDPTNSVVACSQPVGRVLAGDDCDDAAAATYPGAPELCDTADNDCDKSIDDGLLFKSYYADDDADAYGSTVSVSACAQPVGYQAKTGDCDDAAPLVFPGAAELCDGVDNDCDNAVDDGVVFRDWYFDGDLDGYGTASTQSACKQPAGYAALPGDCDDLSKSVFPGAVELCNGKDDDCDKAIDNGLGKTWYADGDGDTYGDAKVTTSACVQPGGYVASSTDCNDADKAVRPGATELCNAIDDDCDALVDEGVSVTWYRDADVDKFGLPTDTKVQCSQPSGYIAAAGDCNDGNAKVNPDATEVCGNLIDDDCDSVAACFGLSGTLPIAAADATFTAQKAGDTAGSRVAWMVDVGLDDGIGEAAIGSPAYDGGGVDRGRVYFLNGTRSGVVALSTAEVMVSGGKDLDRFGTALASGDVDLDGWPDAFVGAVGVDDAASDAGAAYLFLDPFGEQPSSVADADARLIGQNKLDGAGRSVAMGDANGDGDDELIVGAPGWDTPGIDAGLVYLVFPPGTWPSPYLLSASTARVSGAAAGGGLGSAVSFAGDHDGDGLDDLLLGAPNLDVGTQSKAGAAYLLLSPVTGAVSVASVVDRTLTGVVTKEGAGAAVASAGDVDGDGRDDLLIGAPGTGGAMTGKAYLVLAGGSGTQSLAAATATFSGTAGDLAGASVSSADLDLDGFSDLLIGAPGAGAVYFVRGPVSGAVALSSATAQLQGAAAGDLFGQAVAGGVSFTADACPDVLVGAPNNDLIGNNAGAAYVFLSDGGL